MDARDLLRGSLLQLAKMNRVRDVVEKAPVSRSVVRRFVAGATVADAVRATGQLATVGRASTIDYLGEDTTHLDQARHTRDTYLTLLRDLSARGLTHGAKAEVSVKLTALGLHLPDGPAVALEHAREIAQAALNAGTTMTVDMEDHTTTDSTLAIVGSCARTSRQSGRSCRPTCAAPKGTVAIWRTRDPGSGCARGPTRSRSRWLSRTAPRSTSRMSGVSRSSWRVRVIRWWLATIPDRRDRRSLAGRAGREPKTFEYQMLYGVRPDEQQRIADRGDQMRVYIPFGEEWYGYLMRRMAERPANVGFFLRGLATKG